MKGELKHNTVWFWRHCWSKLSKTYSIVFLISVLVPVLLCLVKITSSTELQKCSQDNPYTKNKIAFLEKKNLNPFSMQVGTLIKIFETQYSLSFLVSSIFNGDEVKLSWLDSFRWIFSNDEAFSDESSIEFVDKKQSPTIPNSLTIMMMWEIRSFLLFPKSRIKNIFTSRSVI